MTLTTDELLALPAVCTLEDACRALGMSKTAGYEQVRLGEFPVPVFRVGRKLKVPRSGILERLGVTVGAGGDAESVSLLREISDRLGQLVELTEVRAITAPPGEQAAAEMLQARGWHVVPPRGYRPATQRSR